MHTREQTAEGRTAVQPLAGVGGGACGGEEIAAAMLPDASSLQGALDASFDFDLGAAAAAAHHADGGALASVVSPLLVAAEAPGNASTATGLFGIAALVIALGAG